MSRRNWTVALVLSISSLFAAALSATAQSASIVGVWALTAADKLLPDGTHGLVIFTADGYYSVQIHRAERLKCSSGDNFKATFEEY